MTSNKTTELDSMNRLRVEAASRAAELKAENEKLRAACADLLSVRDRFAIAALPISRSTFPEGMEGGWDALAAHAYTIADAMMRARNAGVSALEAPKNEMEWHKRMDSLPHQDNCRWWKEADVCDCGAAGDAGLTAFWKE